MSEHEHRRGDLPADSAGTPWLGRTFRPQPFADDDGSVPAAYAAARERFRAGEAPLEELVDVLRGTRLLVPLVAELGEEGTSPDGRPVDKSADLAIVTVEGPDGRSVLPAFTGVEAMRAWNEQARPVPVEARKVAVAAADAATELMIIDPGSPQELGVRRPALWAIAKGEPWVPPWRSEEVIERIGASFRDEPLAAAVDINPGGRAGTLNGSELAVVVHVPAEAGAEQRDALTARVRAEWAADAMLIERVDSIAVVTTTIPPGGLKRSALEQGARPAQWWRKRGLRRGR